LFCHDPVYKDGELKRDFDTKVIDLQLVTKNDPVLAQEQKRLFFKTVPKKRLPFRAAS
jgi:hypothetical protein